MRWPDNVVIEEDTRSHNGPNQCGYCKGVLGGPHDAECVCLERPVKVKMTLEMIIPKPRSWSKEKIESYLNDSSWCSDNIFGDVQRTFEASDMVTGNCTCQKTTFEYLGEATAEEAIAAGLRQNADDDS